MKRFFCLVFCLFPVLSHASTTAGGLSSVCINPIDYGADGSGTTTTVSSWAAGKPTVASVSSFRVNDRISISNANLAETATTAIITAGATTVTVADGSAYAGCTTSDPCPAWIEDFISGQQQGLRLYFNNYNKAIGGVDTGAETFTLSGVDATSYFPNGAIFLVDGSTGNDAEWTVSSSSYAASDTVITVTGNITDATVDGTIYVLLADAGDTYYTHVDGTLYEYEIQSGDNLSEAATGLANAINNYVPAANITATAYVDQVIIRADSVGQYFDYLPKQPTGRGLVLYSVDNDDMVPLEQQGMWVKVTNRSGNDLTIATPAPANVASGKTVLKQGHVLNTRITAISGSELTLADAATNTSPTSTQKVFHNSYNAFSAAATRATAKEGCLSVMPGEYYIISEGNTINMVENSLFGSGLGQTVIYTGDNTVGVGAYAPLFDWANAGNDLDGVTVRDLTIDNKYRPSFLGDGSGASTYYSVLTQTPFVFGNKENVGSGADYTYMKNLSVRNVEIKNTSYLAIQITNPWKIDISFSRFINHGGVSILQTKTTLSGTVSMSANTNKVLADDATSTWSDEIGAGDRFRILDEDGAAYYFKVSSVTTDDATNSNNDTITIDAPTWTSGNNYYTNDAVVYTGSYYRLKKTTPLINSTSDPATDTTNWETLPAIATGATTYRRGDVYSQDLKFTNNVSDQCAWIGLTFYAADAGQDYQRGFTTGYFDKIAFSNNSFTDTHIAAMEHYDNNMNFTIQANNFLHCGDGAPTFGDSSSHGCISIKHSQNAAIIGNTINGTRHGIELLGTSDTIYDGGGFLVNDNILIAENVVQNASTICYSAWRGHKNLTFKDNNAKNCGNAGISIGASLVYLEQLENVNVINNSISSAKWPLYIGYGTQGANIEGNKLIRANLYEGMAGNEASIYMLSAAGNIIDDVDIFSNEMMEDRTTATNKTKMPIYLSGGATITNLDVMHNRQTGAESSSMAGTPSSGTVANNFDDYYSYASSSDIYWTANGNDIYNSNSGEVCIGSTSCTYDFTLLGDTNDTYAAQMTSTSNVSGSGTLNIDHTYTAATGFNVAAIRSDVTLSPSGASNADAYGFYSLPQSASAQDLTGAALIGAYYRPSYTGTNTLSEAIGAYFIPYINNASATVNDAYGAVLYPWVAAGTLTDWYAIKINDKAGAGTATNLWGVHQTGSNYNNFFDGTVRIGGSESSGGKYIDSNGLTVNGEQYFSVADSGDANPATDTLTPTTNNVRLICNDAHGCDITLSESGISPGTGLVVLTNRSVYDCNFADTAGLSELPAGGITLGVNDVMLIHYSNDRWHRAGGSDN